MSKSFRKDLTGQRFGRLTVIEFVPTEDGHSHWRCQCDCGNKNIVLDVNLTRERTLSCGCIAKEELIKRNLKHQSSSSRIYRIWADMKTRCMNPNRMAYKDYGGRGIAICDEWKIDFQAFYNWAMKNGYNDNLSIDRIDNNKGYSPSNCRWVDMKIQNRNTRKNIVVHYNGVEMCLAEVAEISGINYHTLYGRYQRGDRGERLFRPEEK